MKVPRDEILWATYYVDGVKRWAVTSKQARDCYYLYEIRGDSLSKLGKARTPDKLEEKYLEGWLYK